jgi:hypothetical protein
VTDPIDIVALERHHVRTAALALKRSTEHDRVRDVLMLYLDLRDDLDNYFRRAALYFLARFSMQHAALDEIAEFLDVSHEEVVIADEIDLTDVFQTVVNIAGSYSPHIAFFYNICALAVQIVEQDAATTVESDADLKQTVAELIRSISDNYLKISYGLEVLRDRNAVSVTALREWQQQGGRMTLDTGSLDKAVNGVFLRHIWSQLLCVGCRLREKSTDISIPFSYDHPFSYINQMNQALATMRGADRKVIAIDTGKFEPFVPGGSDGKYRVRKYVLEGRTGPLPEAAISAIFDEHAFSYQFLWDSAGIPVLDKNNNVMARPNALTEPIKLSLTGGQ